MVLGRAFQDEKGDEVFSRFFVQLAVQLSEEVKLPLMYTSTIYSKMLSTS